MRRVLFFAALALLIFSFVGKGEKKTTGKTGVNNHMLKSSLLKNQEINSAEDVDSVMLK